MNEDLKGLIEEMVDIYGHFESLRYRNDDFTRETLRYVAEMAMIHPPKPPFHYKWEEFFEYASTKIDLLLYEAESDITIEILKKIMEQV